VLSHVGQTWSHLVAGLPSWSDYSVGADVKAAQAGAGSAEVAGRFQDVNNYYACGIKDGSSLQLVRVVKGERQVLRAARIPAARPLFHKIRMVMKGNQLSCSLDATSVLHATDGVFGTGQMALIAAGSLPSEFGNVAA